VEPFSLKKNVLMCIIADYGVIHNSAKCTAVLMFTVICIALQAS